MAVISVASSEPISASNKATKRARAAALSMLSNIRLLVGSLDRVHRVVKVLGRVNATPDFKEHPKVINGLLDLMADVFGENGRGGRAAVGMGSLSDQIAVEVEMVLEIRRRVAVGNVSRQAHHVGLGSCVTSIADPNGDA